jgi:hypothetical protein
MRRKRSQLLIQPLLATALWVCHPSTYIHYFYRYYVDLLPRRIYAPIALG